jgi:hypothetical protein
MPDDIDEIEGIVYNIRKGYAIVTDEDEFTKSINSLYRSIRFWEDMTEDEKKQYGYYDE